MSAIAEGPTPVRAPVHARSRRTTAILIHGGKLGGVQSLVGGHQGGGALPRATLAMTTTSAVAEAIRSGRVDCTARKARRILRVAKKAELNNGKLLLGIPPTLCGWAGGRRVRALRAGRREWPGGERASGHFITFVAAAA